MSQPYLGQIRIFSFNFNPRGWALCNGQILSIQQNAALFSILGTTYGGNGVSTFALPNLQGRSPMHWGTGPGLSTRVLGEVGGTESVTLIQTQIPQHNHLANANTGAPNQGSPSGNNWAQGSYSTTSNTTMLPTDLGNAGNNQPHPNQQPYLVVNFCIALQGIFPSRN